MSDNEQHLKRMEHTQTYCYFAIVMIDTFHSFQFFWSFHLGILLCVIWVRHAYNVMFTFEADAENVTHLKNGDFKCGPTSEPLA